MVLHRPVELALLSSASGLSPRVVVRGHPLPLHLRWFRLAGPFHGRLGLGHARFRGCRNFLPPLRGPTILAGDGSAPPSPPLAQPGDYAPADSPSPNTRSLLRDW